VSAIIRSLLHSLTNIFQGVAYTLYCEKQMYFCDSFRHKNLVDSAVSALSSCGLTLMNNVVLIVEVIVQLFCHSFLRVL